MRYLIPILLLFAFSSCRTMRKNTTEKRSSVDSAYSVVKEQGNITTDNSTRNEQKETQVAASNVKIKLTYSNNEDSSKVEIRTVHLPAGFSNKKGIDKIIDQLLNERLREVEIEGDFNLTANTKTETQNNIQDSTYKKDEAKGEVKKNAEEIIKSKVVKGMPWYTTTIFWLIIIVIVTAFIIYKKSSIMKFIKNVIAKLLLFSILLFAFSCNNPSPDITGSATEWSGNWDMGKQVNIDYVYVQPTWGQSFYYSLKDGGRWQLVAGILLIIGAIGWGVLLTKNILKAGLVNILIIFFVLAGGLAFIFSRPGTIKWNSNIKIEKAVYEKYKADDNLKGMWDMLYADKRIVGTSGE